MSSPEESTGQAQNISGEPAFDAEKAERIKLGREGDFKKFGEEASEVLLSTTEKLSTSGYSFDDVWEFLMQLPQEAQHGGPKHATYPSESQISVVLTAIDAYVGDTSNDEGEIIQANELRGHVVEARERIGNEESPIFETP